jgi:uncharacterized phage-associated protein
MLINRDRQKLINAVIFFANNVEKCGKVKLFKLMYFLDFEHYKITGRNVTSMDYYAWKMGPVPTALFDEINSPEPDMAEAILFEETQTRRSPMLKVTARKKFDASVFSKRELKIMEQLASQYKNNTADDMIEATHLENLPWDKVYHQENGQRQIIPYDLALRSQEFDEMQRIAQEHKEIRAKLS